MRHVHAITICLLLSRIVSAHPGVGIVADSRGNVFYTDLKQVWKIGPDGQKSVVVPSVHTHELRVDDDDSIVGEHLWYEGDATKKWGHRVWRLAADGTLSDVVAAREGFLEDDGFVRDRAGNRYWIPLSDKSVIRRRSPDGKIEAHATSDFRDPRWMTATAAGTLYLIDSGNLLRISSAGQVTTLVKRLSGRSPPPAAVTSRHYHMGLWTDAEDNVYVTVPAEKSVLKVKPDGNTSIAVRTTGLWSASGGMVDRAGNLWLLENSGPNSRARRIDRDGRERVF